MNSTYSLKLYIASNTVNSELAMNTLTEICHDDLNDDCQIEIIDILENFEEAETEKIVAIPTLLLESAYSSQRRLVGNLSDRKQVLQEIKMLQKNAVYN
ncbi:circadian clock KaiB family protein [Crocosphaera chwakensis]|uniref:Circadian clock protein KaiB n=1 Tax=Crocosphaera chwakensis CCY0110 TaxID=391612 RepID=A3IWD4_9CHRO|nr:circadian clock KaiB family protein [Crocosphaera chwakensis]EAZ89247.1 circadian clock protein KaiB [Crocosphaera chwakensis CCY0110]